MTNVRAKRETRLALVLNGGVSLAVWMSGVTREIDALQHAHEDAIPDLGDDQQAHAQVWRDILEASSASMVTVDLIAGTSAGGLNGALLASAIARGDRLGSSLRDLWVEAGSLQAGKLIQDPSSTERSLLAGDFFTSQILGALGLQTDASGSIKPASSASGGRNCTLLTTATALRTPSADQVGPDSRRVYCFRHRVNPPGDDAIVEGWKRQDFADYAHALALAARASASFPAAFNPVLETSKLAARRYFDDTASSSYLVDGGVLDNAPFGPLLDELKRRPVGEPFDRLLVYVKPSVGGGETPTPLRKNPPLSKVLGKVVGAAREPDDRQDVGDMQRLQQRMRYNATAPHLLLLRLWQDDTSLAFQPILASAMALLDHYRHGRQQAFNVRNQPLPSTFTVPPIEPLPDLSGDFLEMSVVDTATGQWPWGVSAADRILRWWGRILNSEELQASEEALATAFQRVAAGQRLTTVLYEGAEEPWPHAVLKDRLARVMWQGCDAMAPLIPGLAAFAEANPDTDAVTAFMQASLSIEVVAMMLAWGVEDATDAPRFGYHQITPGVRPLLDVGDPGQEPIWERSHLYGSRWGHFGAFGAAEWRKSDWLWGRLDGGRQLIEMLVPAGDARDALLDRLCEVILADEGQARQDVIDAAELVVDATAPTLWSEFAEELDTETREAIVSRLERLPAEVIPGKQARLVLAALGRSRPNSDAEKFWDRRKENARLRLIRGYCWWPRRQVHRKIREQLRM